MRGLGRICNLCGETVWADTTISHYNERHPGEDWDLANWPDGTLAFIEQIHGVPQ